MAAPMVRVWRRSNISINRQVYNQVRFKYWERTEDSIYEKGESRSDRYIGVPKHEKPHPETPRKGQYELNPEKGKIYDKKPFPALLKAGKRYAWCTCGHSKNQPFCDRSHKRIYDVLNNKTTVHFMTKHYPLQFEVEKDGEYWLCNCKQTENRPYCDGTHKLEEIQLKVRS